jgi:uncharacterized membrane protein YkoI
MRIPLAVVVASGLLGAQPVSAQAAEKRLTLQDLPPAVQAAVKAQSQGGTVRGLSKEMEGGATVYEAELTVQGRTKDVTIDAEGKVLIVEDETTLDAVPAPARAAIQKAVGTGKLTMVEKVTKGQTIFYEAQVSNGQKRSEVKVDAEGKPVE